MGEPLLWDMENEHSEEVAPQSGEYIERVSGEKLAAVSRDLSDS